MPRMQISVSAEGLRGSNSSSLMGSGASHPFAVVRVTGGPMKGLELGKTEVIHHARDAAHWTKLMFVNHHVDDTVVMPFTVSIYNERRQGRPPVLLAESTFDLTQVVQSTAGTVCEELPHNGIKIHVRVIESLRGSEQGCLHLHLRGLDIQSIERGWLGLKRSDPYYEIAKKNADPSVGVVHWIVVHRSKFILNHSNPYWEADVIGLEELCHGDLDWPLMIVVRDWKINGQNRVIGQVETTVRELQRRIAFQGNADREQAFELYDEGQTEGTGLICVLKANLIK